MPPQNRGPPQQRSMPNPRQDSGHFEGQGQRPVPNRMPSGQRPPPMNVDAGRGQQPHRTSDPMSPSRRAFGPNTQRSATMPHTTPSGGQGAGYSGQQEFAEPGAVSGYYGPVSSTRTPSLSDSLYRIEVVKTRQHGLHPRRDTDGSEFHSMDDPFVENVTDPRSLFKYVLLFC